jgi:hypothetical protein
MMQTSFTFLQKTSYVKEEVNGTEPCPSVRLPCYLHGPSVFAKIEATATVGLVLYFPYLLWQRGYKLQRPPKEPR